MGGGPCKQWWINQMDQQLLISNSLQQCRITQHFTVGNILEQNHVLIILSLMLGQKGNVTITRAGHSRLTYQKADRLI